MSPLKGIRNQKSYTDAESIVFIALSAVKMMRFLYAKLVKKAVFITDEKQGAEELAHTVLDVAGMINGIGEICDATNAVLYLAEKDYGNATMSAVACIPFLGNAATGAKWIGKGANAVDAIADTAKALDKAMDTVETISDGTRVASNVLTSLPKVDVPTGDSIMDIYKSLAGGMAGTALWKMGDSLDTATDTAKALDKVKDAEKAGDVLDAVEDVSKKTGAVADTVGDVSKRTDDLADTAGDAAKKADTAPAKSNGADDAVENANDTAKPKETLEEVGKIEDNGGKVEFPIMRLLPLIKGGMTKMRQYEYFKNVEKNAVFTEKKCQFCGGNKKCLEGIYFEQSDLKSVCLSCFEKRVVGVDIPDYLKKQVHNNSEIKINKLTYTPPVPWVQFNDWQVCCDDYMQYLGEWLQEDFIRESKDGNGIDIFQNLLSEDFRNQVADINVLWEDLGNDTVAFVFYCPTCTKKRVVCQSY